MSVWTMVAGAISAGLKAASATEHTDLQQLTFVAWAASLPEGIVTKPVTTGGKPDATKPDDGCKPSLKAELAMLPAMGADSGWGRDLEEAERASLPRLVRDELTSQEAPGVAALVVLSVSMMMVVGK